MIISLVFCSLCGYSTRNQAYSTQTVGDVGSYAIPLSGASAAVLFRDYQGLTQLGLATGMTQGATQGLKWATHERRPNGLCCASFPSGHTSLAFTGASFVHFRYGFSYSMPLYLGSLFVAYSRLQSKAHYLQDVAFGAALGISGAYLSTTTYKGGQFSLITNGRYAGIIYRKLIS